MVKSVCCRLPTNCPVRSLTVATTCTSFTSVRNCAHAPAQKAATAPAITKLARHRYIGVPLSFYPHFAIDEVLLLPNRHQFLQPVDPLKRRVERRSAVRRRDNHRYAGFTHQHAAQAMDHRDAFHGV